jgi:hypothetical protein
MLCISIFPFNDQPSPRLEVQTLLGAIKTSTHIVEPITVAAYIEILQRRAAPPTIKQHMAAIRMLFSWLTEKGVLAMNAAREVKTERFSRTEGKTPAFVEGGRLAIGLAVPTFAQEKDTVDSQTAQQIRGFVR